MALSVAEFLEALCHDKAVMLHHAASRAGTVSPPIQSNRVLKDDAVKVLHCAVREN